MNTSIRNTNCIPISLYTNIIFKPTNCVSRVFPGGGDWGSSPGSPSRRTSPKDPDTSRAAASEGWRPEMSRARGGFLWSSESTSDALVVVFCGLARVHLDGLSPGAKNFTSPPTDHRPCFLTRACPNNEFCPPKFHSFFSQFWLIFSSKLHEKSLHVFMHKIQKFALILL